MLTCYCELGGTFLLPVTVRRGKPAHGLRRAREDSKGLAFGARVAFFDIGSTATGALNIPANLETDLFPAAFEAGARVHSNSWGLVPTGGASSVPYEFYDRDVDAFSYANPTFLAVFAAGNDGAGALGTSGTEAELGLGTGTVVAMHDQELAMRWRVRDWEVADVAGWAQKSNYVASFSSNGPAPDGRNKPEVVAPAQR